MINDLQKQENQGEDDKKKRTKIEVIYDILQVIQDKRGKIKPTHLMYKANLSYKTMAEHIKNLKKNSLIKEIKSEGKLFYGITDKGLQFHSKYKQVREFEKTFGL